MYVLPGCHSWTSTALTGALASNLTEPTCHQSSVEPLIGAALESFTVKLPSLYVVPAPVMATAPSSTFDHANVYDDAGHCSRAGACAVPSADAPPANTPAAMTARPMPAIAAPSFRLAIPMPECPASA